MLLINGGSGYVLDVGHRLVTGQPIGPVRGWVLIGLSITEFAVGMIWSVGNLGQDREE